MCHRGALTDLPAPGKLNISSHYTNAESGNAVMTAGMGGVGGSGNRPASVRLSVRPSTHPCAQSSCPLKLPQDPVLTSQEALRLGLVRGGRFCWRKGVRFPLGATGQAGDLNLHTLHCPQWRRLGSEVQVLQAGPSPRPLLGWRRRCPSTRPQVEQPPACVLIL